MSSPSERTAYAIYGDDISRRFIGLVNHARGGALTIVTPFINDFDIRPTAVSARLMQLARMNSGIRLLIAPPDPPHKEHKIEDLLKCERCLSSARKILLLDQYSKFAEELLVKDNLHAKIYIATDGRGQQKCLTGSVNLTRQAFYELAELGIYTNDSEFIRDIENILVFWKSQRSKPEVREYRIWRKDFLTRHPTIKELLEGRDKYRWN